MLNFSGKEMRAGVMVRSTATVWGATVALSERDITVEVGTAALQFLARSGPADLTLVNDVMALRKRQQRAQILVDHEDGDAFGGNAFEARPDLVLNERRQTLGCLVQHDHRRVEQKRTRNGQHLLLPAGELIA